MQNFIYLIGDPETREAAVVDPGWEIPHLLERAARDGYRLAHAFVTHHHFDHVMGLQELLAAVDVAVHVQRDDAASLKLDPGHLRPAAGDVTVMVGRLPVNLLHTPGHTPGSQCLVVQDRLLTGDTLFLGSCGRTDLPGGDAATLYQSLTGKLRPLDDALVVCPGHHYAAAPTRTLGEEKRDNPCLAAPNVRAFLQLMGAA